jgi:hypothetical protein
MDMFVKEQVIEGVTQKVKRTTLKFGEDQMQGAVLVGNFSSFNQDKIAGLEVVNVPTLPSIKLGRVDWSVARFFESIAIFGI